LDAGFFASTSGLTMER